MNRKERAKEFRACTQLIAETATDEQAAAMVTMYDPWSGDGVAYTTGERVTYQSVLYKCLNGHTSQADWAPSVAVSLWAEVAASA